MGIKLISIPLKDLYPVPSGSEVVFFEAKGDEKICSVYRDDEYLTVTIDDPKCEEVKL